MIIRRNPDGSIIEEQATQQSHPALTTRRGMAALSESGRAVPPLFSEIATKVNNAKDKPRKLKVLQEHDSVALRQVLKGAFDPNIEWLLPPGDVPYTPNDAPEGTDARDLIPLSRVISTSTVGLPLESRICLPKILSITFILIYNLNIRF